MITFLSMILASLTIYFVNDWLGSSVETSIKAMLDLVIFIAVYMFSNRYLKRYRD